MYGFPLVFNLDQVQRFVTDRRRVEPGGTVQRVQPRAHAGRAGRHVRLDQQRHRVLDGPARPGRRAAAAARARHRRPLLRAAVRRRLDQQLRLRRQARHRHGRGRVPARPARLGRATPAGATRIRFPTRVASIVGRWACAGDDDLPAVHALQDAHDADARRSDAGRAGRAARRPTPSVPEALAFFEKLRVWSQAFPPRRATSRQQRVRAARPARATTPSPTPTRTPSC